MRTRTSVALFPTVKLGASAARRMLLLIVLAALAGGLLGGCGPAMTRQQVSQENLVKQRTTGDEQAVAESRRLLARSLERIKAEYDSTPPARGKSRPSSTS